MKVTIARSAEIDLLGGFVFYEEQQTDVGEYFLDSLFADIGALSLYAAVPSAREGLSVCDLLRF